MKFCPENETFSQIWVDHGVSQCFMETVTTSIVFGFILVFGSIQLHIYRKYADFGMIVLMTIDGVWFKVCVAGV